MLKSKIKKKINLLQVKFESFARLLAKSLMQTDGNFEEGSYLKKRDLNIKHRGTTADIPPPTAKQVRVRLLDCTCLCL